MCIRSLAARGVRSVRPSPREDRPTTLLRDKDEVAKEKAILHRKAQLPVKEAKRARRRWAKIEKKGMKNLRRFQLVR